MNTATTWRIGQWLNAIQSTFVGLLRVLSVPIVLLLSVASGYTTYYGLSYFITPWIALIVTVAVQSIVVICSLELAGIHWRANPPRYFSVLLTLLVALTVSISFSYFKFYEFSQRDSILIERQTHLAQELNHYLEQVTERKSVATAAQQRQVQQAAAEATRAYLGAHTGGSGSRSVGKGKVWSFYNDILVKEQAKQKQLDMRFQGLDKATAEVRSALQHFSMQMTDAGAYQKLTAAFQVLQGEAESLTAATGATPISSPRLGAFSEFAQGITPSFAMWEHISWFALACAAMVDFFTLILSYRLETTAPGPLTQQEKDLAFQGIRQFGEFTINNNDELEFVIEKTEIERARRVSDWQRMFAVAFLLNRGYLRKMSERSVEFAPNLYPIIAERMTSEPVANSKPMTAAADERWNRLSKRSLSG